MIFSLSLFNESLQFYYFSLRIWNNITSVMTSRCMSPNKVLALVASFALWLPRCTSRNKCIHLCFGGTLFSAREGYFR